MSEKVLVTGGSGFVASWCIVRLLQLGYTVSTTVRSLSREQSVRSAIAAEADAGSRLSFFAADLNSDDGWEEAVGGCSYVLHVASPLGGAEHALIPAARDGTLRVLRASAKAGVKRVVMTSSCAAATPSPGQDMKWIDESLWSDPNNKLLDPYRKSKTLSEQAAWRFMEMIEEPMTLTTVLPGAVIGPVLLSGNPGSVQVIGRMLEGKVPGTPRIGLEIVDVRDLADLHILAMTSEKAGGERFIAVGEFLWMAEVASILRGKLGEKARKVPKLGLPDFVLRFMGLFDPELRSIVPMLGRKFRHTAEKAMRLLDWKPRPVVSTVIDCAESLYRSIR